MSLKLMYITNNPEVALIAEHAGVDRIFVDLEYIGKADRQGGMDTVQSDHTLQDVKRISQVLSKADLLVRVNPIHEATEEYCSSKEEIETAITNGADIIMLPFFKTVEEVEFFINQVAGRCRTMLLLETPEAVECLDGILALKGIDEIHIGINDLSLGYKRKFMFELLADGTVEAKDIIDYLAEGHSIQLTFDANVGADDLVDVASYVNGEWLAAIECINNGDGTITVTLPAICPVGIFVKGEETIAPEATPQPGEPAGGDEIGEGDCKICRTFFPYLGAAPIFHGVCVICFTLIVLAICVVGYIIYRATKKDKEKKEEKK